MTRDLILTFNTGSSTIKLGFYALEAAAPRPLASGVIDFRDEPFEVRLTREGKTFSGPITADPGDLTAVLNQAFAWLAGHFNLSRLAVIGHRVVHGGDVFTGPARITDQVIAQIDALARIRRTVRQMGAAYPELTRGQAMIEETLRGEEARFRQTLDRGLRLLGDEVARLPAGADLPGETAFRLYDTYGFPLDLTQDALREQGRATAACTFGQNNPPPDARFHHGP